MVTAKLQASFSDKISYKRKQNPKLNDEIHAEDPFWKANTYSASQ